MGRLGAYLREHGARWTARRLMEKVGERCFGTLDRGPLLDPGQPEGPMPEAGLISVVVPVYNTQPELLRELAASLTAQWYTDWEACLYDGGSSRADTLEALADIARAEPRIRACTGGANEGISGNTNRAIAMSRGGAMAFCDHDDLLSPDALWRVAERLAQGADMVYSDEDRLVGRHHTDAHLKPDYCPDDLCCANYLCHLTVIRRELVEAVGGLRSGFDGSQDHDLALRCAERAGTIAHVPRVLYHWRVVGTSMSHQKLRQCREASARAVAEHMARIGLPGTAEVHGDVVRPIWPVTGEPTVELLLLSERPEQQEASRAAWERDGWPRLRCTPVTDRAALDRAALASSAELLLLWDASILPEGSGALRELVSLAQRPGTAAVSPLVTDRRGRIVHAGYALMADGRVLPRDRGLLYRAGGRAMVEARIHDVAAVSARCCLLRREVFRPLGGLGDAAWCLSLEGHCVVDPWARATAERPFRDAERLPSPVPDPCLSPWYTNGRAPAGKARRP